jgi:hypothetical protein
MSPTLLRERYPSTWVPRLDLYLEPTLVEVVPCMVGDLLNDALQETIHTAGVPEPAARAMLMGHVQVGLANGLRGDNPSSDACLIAMDWREDHQGELEVDLQR